MSRWIACVLVVFALVVGCKKEPDKSSSTHPPADDAAKTFKEFVPRFIDAFKAKESYSKLVYDVSYDLKKTDSALNPLVGVLEFKCAKDQDIADSGLYSRYKLSFVPDGGKWVVNQASWTTHDGNIFEETEVMNGLAKQAQN